MSEWQDQEARQTLKFLLTAIKEQKKFPPLIETIQDPSYSPLYLVPVTPNDVFFVHPWNKMTEIEGLAHLEEFPYYLRVNIQGASPILLGLQEEDLPFVKKLVAWIRESTLPVISTEDLRKALRSFKS